MTDKTILEGMIVAAHASGKLDKLLPGPSRVHADIRFHGTCTNPIVRRWQSGNKLPEGLPAVCDQRETLVWASLRCRQCKACRRARATYWREAATREITASALSGLRTWFGTLTLSPHERALCDYRAAYSMPEQHLRGLSPQQEFGARDAAIKPLITLALKRLRNRLGGSGAFRYLIVAEAHKDGFPHYHLLVHEADQARPLRKSVLNDFWQHGHSTWRLVKEGPKAAGYVAKYLSKAALSRVRASQLYGEAIHHMKEAPPTGRPPA